MNHIKLFADARRAGAPIVVIRTPDHTATIMSLMAADTKSSPFMQWDVCRGIIGVNPAGVKCAEAVNQGAEAAMTTGNPIEALQLMLKNSTPGSVLFLLNANLFIETQDPSRVPFIQAVWNVRDEFKSSQRTLVLLVSDIKTPPELANDVVTIDVALPGVDELKKIAGDIYRAGRIDQPDEATLGRVLDATSGLSSFSAEQSLAMSLRKDGIDVAALWERKRTTIEQTGGLKVSRTGVQFDDLGGLDNIKEFARMVLAGKRVPKLVVLLDEIEKSMSGLGDSNGINQDALGQLLGAMQNNNWSGMLLPGFPGTGKTEFANALGTEAGGLFIQMDLGATKGSLVGQSEKMIRSAIATLLAMGGQEVMFVGTCNSMAGLRPELKRRFGHGTFFFDIPTEAERTPIWNIYRDRFELKGDKLPECRDWTGAEIKKCSQLAYELGIPLVKAAQYITPVAKVMGEEMVKLRQSAHGRYLSASTAGLYQMPGETKTKSRAIGNN